MAAPGVVNGAGMWAALDHARSLLHRERWAAVDAAAVVVAAAVASTAALVTGAGPAGTAVARLR
ncbi:hypothetical protein ACN27G_10440 [Plantactinospora sp. WMMB334]|uniref:hypothetical protein n=1 Tax=Plantactinospora sp. WMMB334 TaxID=3404119 RepID=UPI003B95CD3F